MQHRYARATVVLGALLLGGIVGDVAAGGAGFCGGWDARLSVDGGFDGVVLAMTYAAPGDGGGAPAQLFAGGDFEHVNGAAASRIAAWDGSSWSQVGGGISGRVAALCAWDPDGDGPLAPVLVAGGTFASAGGVAASNIAVWDGSAWSALAEGVNASVFALSTWDPDGQGPLPPVLVAGGQFTTAGAATVNRVAVWDGSAWSALGSGMSGGSFPFVYALTAWDADGDGAQGEVLVAAGNFLSAGGVAASRIAAWDGVSWSALGSGVSGAVTALRVWDPDDAGSLPARLVAGGFFGSAGGVPASRIAMWNGAVWQAVGAGADGPVWSLATWDPDGSGSAPAQLVAGGFFASSGGVTVNGVMRWDGDSWWPLGTGISGADDPVVYTLAVGNAEGKDGLLPAPIAAGGQFDVVDGVTVGNAGLWTSRRPQVTEQPSEVSVLIGETAAFSADGINGALAYRWRRDSQELKDGATMWGSVIAGAMTRELVIEHVQPEDQGGYALMLVNSCGDESSDVALLVVTPPACPGDANGDNLVDGADLSVLLGQFGTLVTPGTGADFNFDGHVNGADLSVLLGQFGAAC